MGNREGNTDGGCMGLAWNAGEQRLEGTGVCDAAGAAYGAVPLLARLAGVRWGRE